MPTSASPNRRWDRGRSRPPPRQNPASEHRSYFYWEMTAPACRCPPCDLNPADQALLVENRILAALRLDPRATLAHLAYTLTPRPGPACARGPRQFAPGPHRHRRWRRRIAGAKTARSSATLNCSMPTWSADAGQAQVLGIGWTSLRSPAGANRSRPRLEQRRPRCPGPGGLPVVASGSSPLPAMNADYVTHGELPQVCFGA